MTLRLAGLPRRPALTALAVAAALAAGAAGAVLLAGSLGQGQADDPLAGPDYYAAPAAVCTLLDLDDLELALAAAYEEGIDPGVTYSFAGIPGITKCYYPPATEGYGSVEIGVVYAFAEQVLREHREAIGDRAVDVDGVGQEALWDREAGELLVLADDKVIGVSVPPTAAWHERDLLERARRLAHAAIGRLR